MGGTADGGQTVGLDASEDLVRVREAAQVVGFSTYTVRSWIKSGKLTVQPGPGVRRVSLAAVQALAAPPDPHAPADAVGIYEALRLTDVTRRNIEAWLTEGRLPSWHGRLGRLVRVADVQATRTQQRAMAAVAAGDGTPRPHDALLIGDAARQVGVSRGRLYNWIRQDVLSVWLEPGGGQRVRLADVVALMERPGRALPSRRERES